MPHHFNTQPRAEDGRWTDGNIPAYIKKKIDKNKSEEEKREDELVRRIMEAEERGLDSVGMYQDEEGNWNPERQALHEEVINDFLNEGTSQQGIAYSLGGAPANGKSTLVESGFLQHPDGLVRVDPDAIKARLPEYSVMLKNKVITAASFTHEESSYISKEIINRASKQKKDFVVDGVGDGGIDKLVSKVDGWKKQGFRTRADYVTLDTDLSLKLAEARGKKTGRYVPEDYIKSMNKEISNLVPELAKRNVFDELNLWDTNVNGKPVLIMKHYDGATTIYNQELFDNFLKKGK